jgi:hypothetical protein
MIELMAYYHSLYIRIAILEFILCVSHLSVLEAILVLIGVISLHRLLS